MKPTRAAVIVCVGILATAGACSDDASPPAADDAAAADATSPSDAHGGAESGAQTDDANGLADGTVRSDSGGGPNGGADGSGDSGGTDSSGAEAGLKDAAGDGALGHDAAAGDAGACVTQAPTMPNLRVQPVNAAGAGSALYAMQPPGSDDWYFVEQRGRIRILRGGSFLATPFLDISAAMGANFGERGLLGLAFHPSYAQNGRFFVMGTPADGADGTFSATNADAVVEFQRDPSNADVALPTKVRDIVVLPVSDDNHNAGTIQFGADNYLYVATGDGGGGCESSKPGATQDVTQLFGKILRLDVDGAAPFAAPGNPFTNDARVYHYGLRNPFRFNFDPATGDLFIGQVGQDTYEALFVAPGNAPAKNFGWPAYEGAVQGTCGSKPLGGPSPETPPIVNVDRASAADPFHDYSSIIGGRVYRGAAIPALQGVLLFADFAGAELGALRYCGGNVYGPVAVALSAIPTGSGGGSLGAITQIVEGHDGELYLMYDFGSSRLGKLVLQ